MKNFFHTYENSCKKCTNAPNALLRSIIGTNDSRGWKSALEHFTHSVHGGNKGVDLLHRVVQGK